MSKEEKETEIWTIESLVALTDKVQNEDIDYRGKVLPIQFCELTEEEEPVGSFKENFENEEERMSYYQEIGTLRVLKMLEKANEKVPEGKLIDGETWAKLPTTLRYAIANKVMAIKSEVSENFTMG